METILKKLGEFKRHVDSNYESELRESTQLSNGMLVDKEGMFVMKDYSFEAFVAWLGEENGE